MKINVYLIRLSFSIMLIFGGTLSIYYLKSGDILVYNLIATCAGVILLLASWMWRISNHNEKGELV
ncbi:hypothetical protein [Rossellomorea sp. YZS02]|uniref:hypothetical protein n=1 Tax=Rossellomorea sp. YZS02 TaxID=3097358 RepID=UPI002A0C70A5|nr:hypothetical protein [Rossellomorea sp. YZS02]MDX8344612.1 hypothetical protein [Rossellomorea sp. YZS02]